MVKRPSVEEAVLADVAELGVLPASTSALVASALALARAIDADSSAASKAACARSLRETLDRLRELAPRGEDRGDGIDELRRRREGQRRSA